MLKKFLISPPFGNYLQTSWATSVQGTFTLEKRPGLAKQVLKTVRPVKGGWRNQIGFRNKGIKNVTFKPNTLISVAGLTGDDDWLEILDTLPENCMVELNDGCPNVDAYNINFDIIRAYVAKFSLVVLKMKPDQFSPMRGTNIHKDTGLNYIHLSNTLPTEKGGISGKQLKEVNLSLVRELRDRTDEKLKIIAGGGIYSEKDLIDYREAGADHFSLSTVWLTPWKIPKIVRTVKKG